MIGRSCEHHRRHSRQQRAARSRKDREARSFEHQAAAVQFAHASSAEAGGIPRTSIAVVLPAFPLELLDEGAVSAPCSSPSDRLSPQQGPERQRTSHNTWRTSALGDAERVKPTRSEASRKGDLAALRGRDRDFRSVALAEPRSDLRGAAFNRAAAAPTEPSVLGQFRSAMAASTHRERLTHKPDKGSRRERPRRFQRATARDRFDVSRRTKRVAAMINDAAAWAQKTPKPVQARGSVRRGRLT